jgi:hypothetical protein
MLLHMALVRTDVSIITGTRIGEVNIVYLHSMCWLLNTAKVVPTSPIVTLMM